MKNELNTMRGISTLLAFYSTIMTFSFPFVVGQHYWICVMCPLFIIIGRHLNDLIYNLSNETEK